MMKHLHLFLFSAVLSVFLFGDVHATTLTMGDAINKAGRQRMLSQRIVKAYALVGQKAMLSANMQLKKSIELFDAQLNELTQFAATPEEKQSIKEVTNLWKQFKPLAQAKPNIDEAPKLAEMSDQVLAAAHQFVLLLQKRSGTNLGKLVNISGRQRMLSQRIAKFYVLTSWGLDNPEYPKKMNKAIREFTEALHTLKTAPENTSEIKDALEKVEKDWTTFTLSKKIRGGRYMPSLIVRSLDKILDQMNYITALYANITR